MLDVTMAHRDEPKQCEPNQADPLGGLSCACIENLLKHLRIRDYSIICESLKVQVQSRDDLMKILINLAPFEGMDEYPRHLDQVDGKIQARIGAWNFETGLK